MKRSYFIPILSLGIILFFIGLYGIRAARIALEDYYEQRRPYVRKTVWLKLDSKTLLQSLEPAKALRCENMRLHALSTTFVGLVFIVWAFDRRSIYSRLQNVRDDEPKGSWPKAKMQIRSIALCIFLLIFATGAVLQLRQIMPEWVNHVRTRSDRNKEESIRAALEAKGLPVVHIYWGRGKGWKSVSLAGPQVKDISPLAELPIARLELINTQVTGLNPLNKSALRSLSLVKSPVSDISPLKGTKIQFLNLIGTDVTDLQPLCRMPELRTISLSRQQVMDNMDVLSELDLFVKEVQGGPAFRTSDPNWRQEYESADINDAQPR